MERTFTGSTAVVTGAASGMGRDAAADLARRGARVVVVDVDADAATTSAEKIVAAGDEAIAHVADVSDPGQVTAFVQAALEWTGRLDVAVNCAAIETESTQLVDADVTEFDRIIGVNLRGTFLCIQAEARAMRDSGGGAIVNFASVNTFRPRPKQVAYNASKAGVAALTRTAAIECAPDGIRVNAIAPGIIDTPMLRKAMDARGSTDEQVAARMPIGRIGDAAEVSEAVAWLCSDAASYVTGQILAVDGGYLA